MYYFYICADTFIDLSFSYFITIKHQYMRYYLFKSMNGPTSKTVIRMPTELITGSIMITSYKHCYVVNVMS